MFYRTPQVAASVINYFHLKFNHLSVNFTKWSNTLKQFVGKLPKNCLSVFDHFVGLALKGLSHKSTIKTTIKTNSICPVPFSYICSKLLSKKLWQFIFRTILCSQHIFLNIFRWMRLNYENYFRRILF